MKLAWTTTNYECGGKYIELSRVQHFVCLTMSLSMTFLAGIIATANSLEGGIYFIQHLTKCSVYSRATFNQRNTVND